MTCHSGKTKHIRERDLLDPPDQYTARAFRCDSRPEGWTAAPCEHIRAERRPSILADVIFSLRSGADGGYEECLTTDPEEIAREILDLTDILDRHAALSEEELRPIVAEAQASVLAQRSTTA